MSEDNLYETDYYGWTLQQIETLNSEDTNKLDSGNLIKELEEMGRKEKRSLASFLKLLIHHLLKWQYQSTHRTISWELTIINCRQDIGDILEDSPSLEQLLPTILDKAYTNGLINAIKETGISRDNFPKTSPWTFKQIMDDAFWPEEDINGQ